MQAAALPAIAGWYWVKDGWLLFKRQPLAFFSLALFISLMVIVSTSLSPVGPFIFVILMPASTFMIVSGCRHAASNRRISPLMWFQAFVPAKILSRMIGLGALYLGICLLSALCSFIPFSTELTESLQKAIGTNDLEPLMTAAQIPLSIFFVLYLVITALFWYTPMLVGWYALPLGRALFFSLIACWRNKLSMLLYGFLWVAVFLGIDAGMSLLSTIGIPEDFTSKVQIPLNMLAASIMYCSFYPNYVSVFEASPSPSRAQP